MRLPVDSTSRTVSSRSSRVAGSYWTQSVRPARDVDGDDVGSLVRHPHGVRAALPARRSGDEGDLAFELDPSL